MAEWRAEIAKRLGGLKLPPAREAEIVEELAQHLEDRCRDLRLAGATDEDARRAVEQELNDDQRLTAEMAAVERAVAWEPATLGGTNMNILADLVYDLRYGARMLRRAPGFTAVGVICLALGIGGATTIFSIIRPVLMSRLPYKDPDRLAMLFTKWKIGNMSGDRGMVYSSDYLEWKDQAHAFEQIEAFSPYSASLAGGADAVRVRAAQVTPDMFSILGARPILGRAFSSDDPGAGNPALPGDVGSGQGVSVAVISSRLWRANFGADAQIIGQTIKVDGNQATVVGVMAPGFSFPRDADLWLPLTVRPDASNTALNVIGRLRPGMPLSQSATELGDLEERLAQARHSNNSGVNLISLRRYVVGEVEPLLLVLFGAVGFVLLIACANVANLLLARGESRQREIAIRVALGARRERIGRQLLTESALLALVGGAAGLGLAYGGLTLFLAVAPANIPNPETITIDLKVLGFALLLSLFTGLLFGLAPALTVSKPDVNAALKDGAARSGARSGLLRGLMVISETALALVLLVGSGLMIKSFALLNQTRVGFASQSVLTMDVSLPPVIYKNAEQIRGFYEQSLGRLQSLPGVASAAAVSALPLGRGGMRIAGDFIINGSAEPPGNLIANKVAVSADYFRAMGVPLIGGRFFDERDRDGAPDAMIISESVAKEVWPGDDAIGKRISLGFKGETPSEIVGVVGDVRQDELEAGPAYAIYQSYLQVPRTWQVAEMTFVIKTDSDPRAAIAPARAAIQSVDKDLPVFNARLMDQVVADRASNPRFNTVLLGALAAIALALAAAGIYGVVAYSVARRTHEIGIRIALGAHPSQVVAMFIRRGAALALIGLFLGTAAAGALTRFIASFLYQTTPTDLSVFAGVGLLLMVVALIATYVPARSATRIDPLTALRQE